MQGVLASKRGPADASAPARLRGLRLQARFVRLRPGAGRCIRAHATAATKQAMGELETDPRDDVSEAHGFTRTARRAARARYVPGVLVLDGGELGGGVGTLAGDESGVNAW